MSGRKIHTEKLAQQELKRIIAYIVSDNCELVAKKQKERIERDVELLRVAPYIGQSLFNGYRKLSISPYVVIYRVEDDVVRIIRVFDSRQDWQSIYF